MVLRRLALESQDPNLISSGGVVPTKTAEQQEIEDNTPVEGEGNDAYKTEHEEPPFLLGGEIGLYNDAERVRLNELKDIASKLALEGLIDRDMALSFNSVIPNFYEDNGGGNTFTNTPSLEGLVAAQEAIDSAIRENFAAGYKKVAQWAIELYNKLAEAINRFIERMKNSGNAGNSNVMSELNERNLGVFNGAEKIMAFMDEAFASSDKVVALLHSGIREALTDPTPEQEASIDRSAEVLRQQIETLKNRVENGFKKALSTSSFGKKMMGVTNDADTPGMDEIHNVVEGVKKIAYAMGQLQGSRSVEQLNANLDLLAQLQQEYSELAKDKSNQGEMDSNNLENLKMVDIYKQAVAFVEKGVDTANLNAMKDTLNTMTSFSELVRGMANTLTKTGESLASIEGIDEETIAKAKGMLQSSAKLTASLVTSTLRAADVISGATQGKVWVTSEFSKLVNSATGAIRAGAGPLSKEAGDKLKDNALEHFGIQLKPAA